MAADERVAKLAARQHGLVTGRQLRRLGLGAGAIRRRHEAGRLHRVHIGVYAVGHTALTGEAGLLAAVMACGSAAVLSHEHAASHWGLLAPWDHVDPTVVNVTVPPTSGRGRRAGIAIHRAALDPDQRTIHGGIPISSTARTLLDLGARLDLRQVERAVDQAITDKRTTPDALRAVLSRSAGSRGAAVLHTIIDAAERFDHLTRSQLEESFLALVRGAGLSPPALNVRIEKMRVDAVWRAERVAVELDGYRWHRTRSRIEADRDREAKLRRRGWTPLRYSARQVFDQPLVVVGDVASVLARNRT